MPTPTFQTPPVYPKSDYTSPQPIIRPKAIIPNAQINNHQQIPRQMPMPQGPKKKALIVACNYPRTAFQLSVI